MPSTSLDKCSVAPQANAASRRADLDWLRLLAFGALLLFHSALPFSGFGWYIKDTARSPVFDVFVLYLHEFRLPLLFVVSGAGLALAQSKRSVLSLSADRVKRLLIPLVFGLLVVIPPHAYFEYRVKEHTDPGFFHFWSIYFQSGIEPPGYIGFKHLWYLIYLLVLSLLLMPLLVLLRRLSINGALERFAAGIRPWHLLFLLPAPWIANEILLRRFSFDGSLIQDPAGLIQYGLFILVGNVVALSPGISDVMVKARRLALVLGVPAFAATALTFVHFKNQGLHKPEAQWLVGTLRGFNTWLWVVFWIGTARRHLSTAPHWLRSTNRFVYPCYVLHEPAIVAIAFYAVQWSVPMPLKYVVIVLVAGIVTVGITFLADRVPVLRQCLGIWQPRKTTVKACGRHSIG